MTAQQPQTGISVRTRIFPLAFILLLFKTTVTVDGMPYVVPWGEHFFPVPPGTHQVWVTFKYIFGDMGGNGVGVDVAPGQIVRIHYRSPFLVFMKGRIRLEQAV